MRERPPASLLSDPGLSDARPVDTRPVDTRPVDTRLADTRLAERRLVDTFDRVATDLRVSLTDRCTLRCSYCMPPEGLEWLPSAQVLDDGEVIRLITIAITRLGIDEVRFTGGEPLLRPGLADIIEATTALRTAQNGVPRTSLTTNGLALSRRASLLAAAGLERLNVSLDTLDAARFARLTHRDRHHEVLAGLEAAAASGFSPIKVNAILMRGVNDDEAVPLLAWCLERGFELRFIEQMPLDPHGAWKREEILTVDDVLARLMLGFDLVPVAAAERGSAPAETWWVHPRGTREAPPDGRGSLGRVGIIGSVTRSFCGACDRTRLTADGQVRSCLFSRSETDLRGLIRAGAEDEDIAEAWRAAMWAKAAGHGIGDPLFVRPTRPMSAIGG